MVMPPEALPSFTGLTAVGSVPVAGSSPSRGLSDEQVTVSVDLVGWEQTFSAELAHEQVEALHEPVAPPVTDGTAR